MINKTEISFRQYTLDDKEEVLEMMASFNAIDGYIFNPEIGSQNLTEFTSNEALGRFYLIKYQQLNIGYIALSFGFSFEYKGRDAFIDELYIKKEYRKHGIGKLAMDFIEIESKRLNVNAIHLEVESHNENAHRLYTKKGYTSNNRKLMTKKIKLLVFALFFITNIVFGQDCDEANYTFTTQEAIDQFGINYPDCKDITGSLTIDGTDIVNLNGLSQIKTIGWHLKIYNSSLTDLSSFRVSEFTIDDFLITRKSVNVSTASVEHTNKVEIYPNPVFSDLYINSSKSYDRIVIFNHLGQKIKTYSFEGSINISHLSPGVYYLIIEGVDNHVIRKIIKM